MKPSEHNIFEVWISTKVMGVFMNHMDQIFVCLNLQQRELGELGSSCLTVNVEVESCRFSVICWWIPYIFMSCIP